MTASLSRLCVAVALLLVGGCTEPVTAPGLVPLSVRVGGVEWTLLVPPEARLVAPASSGAAVSFAPGARASPTLMLAPLGPGGGRSVTLASGAALRYRTVAEDAVGSGGSEATLQGRLTMPDGQGLAVTCATQGEAPDPAWCVAYLHHLRPAP